MTAKLGPEPVLISRKEVEALYDTLAAVTTALEALQVAYVVTGGSLLGAVRQCVRRYPLAMQKKHYCEEKGGGKERGGWRRTLLYVPSFSLYSANSA